MIKISKLQLLAIWFGMNIGSVISLYLFGDSWHRIVGIGLAYLLPLVLVALLGEHR